MSQLNRTTSTLPPHILPGQTVVFPWQNRPSGEENILASLKSQDVKVWGFVLVRCTYNNEARWKLFLAELEKQTIAALENSKGPSAIMVKQYLKWTAIEDKEKLDGATMLQASNRFQEWTKTIATRETGTNPGSQNAPRYRFYVYVNEETIESIINPIRAREDTGNFLVLVHLYLSLKPEEDGDLDNPDSVDDFADEADESFKLIRADAMSFYADYAETMNNWYDSGSSWDGPPFVHGRGLSWTKILKQHDAIGMDVYRMLKRIYGTGNYRSKCFTSDVAQTSLERLRGYDGGNRFGPYFPK